MTSVKPYSLKDKFRTAQEILEESVPCHSNKILTKYKLPIFDTTTDQHGNLVIPMVNVLKHVVDSVMVIAENERGFIPSGLGLDNRCAMIRKGLSTIDTVIIGRSWLDVATFINSMTASNAALGIAYIKDSNFIAILNYVNQSFNTIEDIAVLEDEFNTKLKSELGKAWLFKKSQNKAWHEIVSRKQETEQE